MKVDQELDKKQLQLHPDFWNTTFFEYSHYSNFFPRFTLTNAYNLTRILRTSIFQISRFFELFVSAQPTNHALQFWNSFEEKLWKIWWLFYSLFDNRKIAGKHLIYYHKFNFDLIGPIPWFLLLLRWLYQLSGRKYSFYKLSTFDIC